MPSPFSHIAWSKKARSGHAALGDNGDEQRLIKTFPRKGFRFICSVRDTGNPSIAGPEEEHREPPSDRPSITVLPFQNMNSDPEQEYFADVVVADIIAGLARIKWLFVISRNSSFVYKHREADVKLVGRELGVRYVLEGSIRKAGSRVRVVAQLIEADSGAHIWVERYDRELEDIFVLQDDISEQVVGAIEPNLRHAEKSRLRRRRPERREAYDLVLRAQPFAYSHLADDASIAIPLLNKALALEPDYAAAHAPLALCHHSRFTETAIDRATRALRLSPFDPLNYLSYNALAISYLHAQQFDEARNVAARSAQLNPRFSVSRAFLVAALAQLGRVDEAADETRRLLEIDSDFSVRRFSVTVDIEPTVFGPIAEAWQQAGLPPG